MCFNYLSSLRGTAQIFFSHCWMFREPDRPDFVMDKSYGYVCLTQFFVAWILAYHFSIFLTMLMPVLSTLLLLDVSVSATSNSSIIQHEDPIVFVRHLPNSLPSANSSSTAADVESESYDDSKQDNTDNNETDGEVRMDFFLWKEGSIAFIYPIAIQRCEHQT
ncbi:hypothetical protein Plhal703r1_c18g0083831 [Plasmopara halstedii]